MKISDYDKISDLIDDYKRLKNELQNLEQSNGDRYLGITFQGHYQDSGFCNTIRPVIIEYQKMRLKEVIQKLKDFGVTKL